MKKRVVAVLLSGLVAGPVMADDFKSQAYVGLNYLAGQYEEDQISEDFDADVLFAQLGVQLNPYLAGELRAGTGLSDDSATVSGVDLGLEINSLFGAYLKAGLPTETILYPYVVAGVTRIDAEATASFGGLSASESDSDSSFSYGVGLNIELTDQFVLNAEAMQYYDKDDAELAGISVGGQFRF
ncbi:outer membrane beta-barrel protein [Marinobacter sp. JSM 1782161]|uniref:outer membrane beta-barrel protein n=1 Tax=Marinobacter sp. JSM 1782161 TaxID=2685906 RepID=UPI001403B44D|nr:outer membrane beta-barrel protein [Marinobacter sp. JSM 1782161]